MNKGNLNKLVTNYPVELTEEEIANLSGTLAPVIAACGGGGGGTGGKIYTGVGFVTVNNSTNQIGLTEAANTKLNQDIPTKVSDLSDSANYQTVAGMDEYLTTANAQTLYQKKNDMSAYLTSANASSTYQTKDDMSAYATKEWANNNFISEQELGPSIISIVDEDFARKSYVNSELNKKENKLTFAYDNDKISAINGSALAGQGGTTYTPGQYINIDSNNEISVTGVLALDEYAQYEPVLMGDANITATSSKVGSHTQWNLAINSTPVVTDTKLVGENSITAHTTNVSGEWLVGLEQTAHNAIASIDGISTDVGTLKTASADWNEVSAKLDTTAFSTVSGTFLTTIPDTYALKTDIPTTVAQLTDSANYYKTTETSSKNELSTEFAKYQPTGYYATTAQLNTASSTLTGVDNLLSGHIDYVSGQVDNKLNVPLSSDVSIQDKYLVLRTNANGTVSAWCDFQTQSYSKSEANGTFVATADVGSGLYYSGSTPKLGVKLGTDLAFNATTSAIQINTNGTAGGNFAFVEGDSNTANGNASHAEGFTNNIINSYSHGEGRNNTEFGGNTNHLEGGYNKVNSPENGGYVHIEGEANEVTGHSIHVEGAFNMFNSTSTADRGISIEGYANATSANDTAVHSGILKVIGNGERITSSNIRRSDAYILYKDGTVKAKDFIAGGDTLSANYPVPKSIPNTADNNLQVQKMFVCTSDNDIVAHAALANGEGCIFFRVG